MAHHPRLPVFATDSGGVSLPHGVNGATIRPTVSVRLGKRAKRYHRAKRVMDIVLSLIVLPPIVLVIVICAVAIRMESRGPIFFCQQRTGRGGRRFAMYKLRTMFANAEELKQEFMHLNELSWPDFKITNDPRVTRVGQFLRRTSLDELPQIFNVILGEMSLVGPRPTSFGADTYDLLHTERLEVTPGITGLWQVSGRSNIDFDERVKLDIQYIERRSLGYDLWLLYRTVAAIALGKGAY